MQCPKMPESEQAWKMQNNLALAADHTLSNVRYHVDDGRQAIRYTCRDTGAGSGGPPEVGIQRGPQGGIRDDGLEALW